MNLLEIKNLKMDFGSGGEALRAVDGVSLAIGVGETVCLVGESGCGKTVTALSIARLVPAPPANYIGGEILLNGRDVLKMSNGELRNIRGGVVSYVFQEPGASLNPVFRIGNQIKESLKLHKPEKLCPLTPALSPFGGEREKNQGPSDDLPSPRPSGEKVAKGRMRGFDLRKLFGLFKKTSDAEIIRLLKLVGIPAPESRIKNYPFEMSGGMQQRVMIAMALASEPKLLVADEPTTALDVTIQAQILELLHDLKQRLGMAILLITHNLGIVGDMADRVAVMYAGQVDRAGAREGIVAPSAASLHKGIDECGSQIGWRCQPSFGDSRQRAAYRQFSARLPFRATLPDCQTGMFAKNSRTARSRTRTFREMPVLEN